jgi:hypothetical protein
VTNTNISSELDLKYDLQVSSSIGDSIWNKTGVTTNSCYSIGEGQYVLIVIDSSKHILKNISYKYIKSSAYMDSWNMTYFTLIKDNINIPYYIDNFGNYIAYIKNPDIWFVYCKSIHSQDSMSGHYGSDDRTTFLKVLDSTEEPYIEIKLIL